MKDERDASNFTCEAADFMIKAGEKDEAIKIYKDSTEGYKKTGNFDQAGATFKKIGEYYENQFENELATTYFLQAIDMFSLAKFKTTESTKLKVKVADMYAGITDKEEMLKKAIKMYEEVASEYLNNNLMRFNAKELFVKSVLVFLLLRVS